MKLVFSEAKSDYQHYLFPYVVWAFPETGETPADLFDKGFLPSSRNLDRFYLCRQLRVRLRDYRGSSENRRILRKGDGITAQLLPRAEFDYTPVRREAYKAYIDRKFGSQTMSYDRLDSLLSGAITSHLLVFQEADSGAELGTVTLYLQPPRLAYYYYAFYDLQSPRANLGMFMMTAAVKLFSEKGFEFLHLGSCYSQNALYKTQFTGAEFYNGVQWSPDLAELKYLIRRDGGEITQHLLENEEYRQIYYQGELSRAASASGFVCPAARGSAVA
jgi:arginyl-tRNA--protein-N-Asp/Glu arginylyltransferase